MLSYHISKRHGRDGLPEDTIRIKLHGKFGLCWLANSWGMGVCCVVHWQLVV